MSNHSHFIDEAKAQLDKLGVELDELEDKVKTQYENASSWYGEQMVNLRNEWQETSAKIHKFTTEAQAEAQTSYEAAKSEVERNYDALASAVKTYREQIERDGKTN